MPNVLDIRRRIRSVKNTRQITKAMKMISAARLRKAQERALSSRPYAQMLTNVLKSLVSRAEVVDPETGEPRHPLLARRPENNALLIVVSGDRGLAGAFNTNVMKAAMRFVQSKDGKNIDVEAVGRKSRDFFKRRFPVNHQEEREDRRIAKQVDAEAKSPDHVFHGDEIEADSKAHYRMGPIQLVGERVGMLAKMSFTDARELAESVIERYTEGRVDAVYVVYNEFKSVIAQRLVVEQILPIRQIGVTEIAQAEEAMTEDQRRHAAEVAGHAGVVPRAADTSAIDQQAAGFAVSADYIYEQPADELFRDLLPKYVAVQVFRAMVESVAAEHAARMTAMDSATSAASDMIDSLTLKMNRARQAAITKEIIEIVSGAAAL
jgi:F-type H+-transporting ATPase subunit gamma